MPDYVETEIKLYVHDLNEVAARLTAAGATLTAPRVYERNVRYENAARSLTPSGIVLRLRADTRSRLTYKEEHGQPIEGDVAYSRFEAEVEVSDFDAMHTILVHLGFQPYMTYEKYRTTYTLDGGEIVLDEMPYGTFVEIEGQPEVIADLLTRLDLETAPRFRESYTALFDRVRRRLRLAFADLTFANFEGVDVPASALLQPED